MKNRVLFENSLSIFPTLFTSVKYIIMLFQTGAFPPITKYLILGSGDSVDVNQVPEYRKLCSNKLLLVTVLAMASFATVGGNILVILAVKREERLR